MPLDLQFVEFPGASAVTLALTLLEKADRLEEIELVRALE
jgi:hypothetical protein